MNQTDLHGQSTDVWPAALNPLSQIPPDLKAVETKTFRMTGTEVSALKTLDQAVQAYMQQNNIPGGAVAVSRNGKLMFARGYSWSEPHEETTSPTSLFRIASCSKPLTRIGIQRLVETSTSKLAYSDTIQSILQLKLPSGGSIPQDPEPANHETDGHYFHEVKVEHLMNHSGGWDRGFLDEPTFFKDDETAQAFGKSLPVNTEEIARWGAGQRMQFWPSHRSAYTNFGFLLLGLIIERKTGKGYGPWMRQHVFAPLGIQRARLAQPLEHSRVPGEVAYFPNFPELKPNLVNGVGNVPIQYGGENHANFAAFGGWVMSAPDYVRILAAYAKGQTPPTKTHLKDINGSPRATHDGVGCTEHYGGMPGTSTYAALRDDDIAIALFFNKDAAATFRWNNADSHIVTVSHQILGDVTSWPATDQFPSIMTSPVPPGPERLDVFATGLDGSVSHAAWEANVASARWRGWWPVVNKVAGSGNPNFAVTRDASHLDLFIAGADSKTYTAGWAEGIANQAWRGWWSILTGLIQPNGNLTAVSRDPDKLDAFHVGNDGGVYTAAWEGGVNNNNWAGWWRVGSLTAKPGSLVTAVSRDPNHLDIFAVGTDGVVYTAAWDTGSNGWKGWWDILGGSVPAGGAVTAVSRDPNKLDVFCVSGDGGIYTAAWEGGVNNNNWAGWWRIGSLKAKPGSVVSAVARDPQKLDIFVTGNDGIVYTAAWDAAVSGGWRGWGDILGGQCPAGGIVTAVSRAPHKLDVFVVSGDRHIYTAAWEAGINNNKWSGWWRIGDLQSQPGARVSAVARRLS